MWISIWWNNLPLYLSLNLWLYSLDNNFSSSCIGKSQPKNTHTSLNIKPSWLAWIGTPQKHACMVIILTDDAIKYISIWPLAWCNEYKLYNSSASLQWDLTFSFASQREREEIKDERTYQGSMHKSDRNNTFVLACWYSVSSEKEALSYHL